MATRRTTRTAGALLVCLLLPALLGGCGFYPPDHAPLPGLGGRGEGSYTVTVELPDAQNLVQNQDVRLQDVVVGNIDRLTFENWHAKATVRLDGNAKLPANTTAKVAQKSLLGAEFLELKAPPAGQADQRLLKDGDVIKLDQAGAYPETEEVLSALSTVLNGGGLNQLATINSELAAALNGREDKAKELIHTLGDFVGTLDARKADLVRAIDGLDRLSVSLNKDSAIIANAVDTLPAGLAEVNAQRKDLVDALDAVGEFGDVAKEVIDRDKDRLVDNLEHLEPILKKLADSGNNLTDSVSGILVAPFPADTAFPSVFRGDYGNLFAIFDVQPISLLRNFGVLPPDFGPAVALLSGLPPLGAGLQPVNPLVTPFVKLPGTGAAKQPSPLEQALRKPDTGLGLLGPNRGNAGQAPRKPDVPSAGGLLGSLNGGS